MSWADEARDLETADDAAKRAFIERATRRSTDGLSADVVEQARRKIVRGYRLGTVALEIDELRETKS